jgi:hypothetical protein
MRISFAVCLSFFWLMANKHKIPFKGAIKEIERKRHI